MKIYSSLPDSVNAAILENIANSELISIKAEADIKLDTFPLPAKLGEILDFINSGNKFITLGSYQFNTAKKQLVGAGKIIDLTEKEVAILKFLSASEIPVPPETLMREVWQYAENTSSNTVESHIYRLRQKILSNLGQEIIITENGNYKLIKN